MRDCTERRHGPSGSLEPFAIIEPSPGLVDLFSLPWLIWMNLIALLATLYVCSLINFDAMIANYNVAHSSAAGGTAIQLDSAYIASLGPQALPALAQFASNPYVAARLDPLLEEQARDMASWRSWSFRGWRLQRYLDTHPISYAPN